MPASVKEADETFGIVVVDGGNQPRSPTIKKL